MSDISGNSEIKPNISNYVTDVSKLLIMRLSNIDIITNIDISSV